MFRPIMQPIVPAILAHDRTEFRKKLRAVQAYAPLVHVDVMDGKFVPSSSGDYRDIVHRWPMAVSFEVHLMVRNPLVAAVQWCATRWVERVIVHVESTPNIDNVLFAIGAGHKRAGIAVNPRTPLARVYPHLRHVETVLLMANDPGFSGRPFRRMTLRRIAAIRARFPKLRIGVDIGMNTETVPLVRAAGATYVCAGNTIFRAPDPIAAYRALEQAFLKA